MITIPAGKRSIPLWLWLASQAPAVVTVPVEQESHVFFARATINERGPFWLTVDTGATLTVIDPDTAAGLGLRVTDAGACERKRRSPDCALRHPGPCQICSPASAPSAIAMPAAP